MASLFSMFTSSKPQTTEELALACKALEKRLGELEKQLKEYQKEMRKSFTKSGVVRFNPFGEMGGDQSFSLALLDQDNNGIIVTSHYTIEHQRVYAKPITKGKSEYSLSKEEKEAIEKASALEGKK
ncbi:MAG: DUF4446 family protein [Candidatus Wildermuthbacteria bacterium]|nr:DUF4446 family protein [Candidatus Wildermuthbacteria bacterium]MBI2647722.1 DUF4446 family protein [Candidatus Wildermuthbacteria bacterium]